VSCVTVCGRFIFLYICPRSSAASVDVGIEGKKSKFCRYSAVKSWCPTLEVWRVSLQLSWCLG
jgi:hypothetical protein